MMVWRIFKKDWSLLWPLVAAAAFAQAIGGALWWIRDHPNQESALQGLSQVFPMMALLMSAIVCIVAVQNDAIPGDREDWLARPIRRGDLLAAKLLFVVLAVAGPVVLISIADGLLYGFSFAASADAALSRILTVLVQICLPAMLLGALTRNLVEALLGAVIAGAGAVAVIIFFTLAGIHPTLIDSGLDWWDMVVFTIAIVAAALVILPLQYFRRATSLSRLLVAAFFLPALFCQVLPWNWAFSAQQGLASGDPASNKAGIEFDPALPRSPRTAISAGVTGHAVLINLPIRADFVPAGQVLFADRAEIRVIEDGQVVYRQESAATIPGTGAFSEMRTQLRQDGSEGKPLHDYQIILLPISVMNRFRDRAVTLEVDYWLSLFRQDATGTMAALDGSAHLDRIGWCQTGIDDDGDEVAIGCVQAGRRPNCLSAVLENNETGQRNPEVLVCDPDYRPVPIKSFPYLAIDFDRFHLHLPFGSTANTQYPVGEAQLSRARVDLVSYQPTAHFTRHVIIPHVRLGDWEAPVADAGASPG